MNHWKSKTIKMWLTAIEHGTVMLPRFQRGEVWNANQVKGFLEAVVIKQALHKQIKPLGIMLVLRVNHDDQPFKTRPLPGTNTDNNTDKCLEHLLDGQQRLTALWKAMNDKYEEHYFIKFEKKIGKYELMDIKKDKNRDWIGNANKEYKKGYIPLRLFSPLGNGEIDRWFDETDIDDTSKNNLSRMIRNLRNDIGKINLPYFYLPPKTSKSDAIDIFIKTNTAGTKLTKYDIAVAQFEEKKKESLQNFVEKISTEIPGIVKLEGKGKNNAVGNLVLKIACLDQNKKPTESNYFEITMEKINLDKIYKGIKWTVTVLAKENIWTEKCLPTTVPLRVLPLIHQYMPRRGDRCALADKLISKYLWRSFFTERYERQANDRLKKDYEALKAILENNNSYTPNSNDNTVFNNEEFPLPSIDKLRKQDWPPKSKGILKRAIIAACNREGARDIATNKEISKENIEGREYHHIFAKALFKSSDLDPDKALNCMLIDKYTNQNVSDKWPKDYLLERIRGASEGLSESEAIEEVKQRLESHLIPNHLINIEMTDSLKKPYEKFLNERAKLIIKKVHELCQEPYNEENK